ncbi:MAG: hypothetical protein JWN44_6488 [Myxococcales bacterium]|nr:hypothetical protein [Myxococcales bacterium]
MQRGLWMCAVMSVMYGATAAATTTAVADEFWSQWGDGKAELDGYALVEPRYGQPREGTAVLIFVTEDFSDEARVKADPGKHAKSDVYPVMKLNLVRDFQTGIYDYNTMTSTFLKTEARWALAKTSFSSQEWCGHVFMQWIPRDGKLRGTSHSYFDGEGDAAPELPFPDGGVVEDALPILVRGLRGAWLAPGESRKVPFLRSQLRTRLLHVPAAWGDATVSRSPAAEPFKSALGTHQVWTYRVVETGGDTITFTVEDAAPHRLLAWKSSSGESARILGSARLKYWDMHQRGGEAALQQLGLVPQALPLKR